MKRTIFMLLSILLISCEPNPTVKPGYILTGTRPIGFKAEPVEVLPGDTVSLSVFIGGRNFEQDSTLPVKWFGTETLTIPYNQPFLFKIPENIDEFLNNPEFPSFIKESFEKNGFADLPVIASFDQQIDTSSEEFRTMTLTKTVRIYRSLPEDGIRKNPVIDHVQAAYLLNGTVDSIEIKNGDNIQFSLKDMPNTIGFKSVADETTGYDRLNYRWYFGADVELSIDKDIDIKIELSDLGDFVPVDEKVTPNRQYFGADFTRILDEIESNPEVLPVTFNFYHVLRDKATSAESSADYRWGSDHMWFTIEITE